MNYPHNLLSNNLKNTIGLSFFSLLLFFVIPRDPVNSFFFGFSKTRLALMFSFTLLFVGLITTLLLLRRNQLGEQKLITSLVGISKSDPWRERILFFAVLAILLGILLIYELITTKDAFKQQIFLRLLPPTIFAIGFSWQVVNFDLFRSSRRRWILTLVLVIFSSAIGISLQYFLLSKVEKYEYVDTWIFSLGYLGIVLSALIFMTQLTSTPSEKRAGWLLVLFTTFILFWLQWSLYPLRHWPGQRYLAILAPTIIFSMVILTKLVFDIKENLAPINRKRVLVLLQITAVSISLLLLFSYYKVATNHAQILNYSSRFTDQRSYLKFAKNAYLTNFRYVGDHNRMPLYPYFQGLFYQPGLTDSQFFEQGKQINIILSLVLLGLMFLIYRKYLPPFESVLLTGIIAFSLYIFKAAYFQAEILYYFLVFLAFLFMLDMFRRPNLFFAVGTGVVLGLAHLTKASILPGFIIFIAVYLTKLFITIIRKKLSKTLDGHGLRTNLLQLVYLLLVIISFILVLLPYIRQTKTIFGRYFYNVNTTFYIWYDDFTQAKEADQAHQFRKNWPSHLEPDQIPSLRGYLREHTSDQIMERIYLGIISQLENIRDQYSVTNYHISYIAIFLIILLLDLPNSIELVKRYPYLIIFSILFFLGYLAAFVWYAPISPERRFTYSLFIPFMFSLFISLKELTDNQSIHLKKSHGIDLKLFLSRINFIILLTLIINIWFVLSERMYFDRYGA